MRSTSTPAPHFSRLFRAASMLLTIACSETTTPPVPTKLAFTVQPGPTTAGSLMFPSVVVAVQDARGNTVTSATNNITLAVGNNPPKGTLSGVTSIAAVNGVATFSNLSVDKADTGYVLSASSPNLTSTTSTPFAVTAGPPAKLAFTVQPITAIARTAIPAFAVAVQDMAGNTIVSTTNAITVILGTNPGQASLSGTTSVQPVNGVATFSNVSISNPGSGYTLIARALVSVGTSLQLTSSAFDVVTGPPAQLAFTDQPITSRVGEIIAPAVTVTVEDAAGSTVSTASNNITVAIGANPGGGSLSGTTTKAAVNGVATFSDLSINSVGAGYSLTATAAGLTGTASIAFSIRDPLVFATVTSGYFHSCGVTTSGAGYCWGDNSGGGLGNGTIEPSSAPAPVSGAQIFAEIGAGRTHTCGVTTTGVGYCWGDNGVGKLGNGTAAQNPVPGVVSGGITFAAIIAGYSHTCGVATDGVGYCWGDNSSGELGNGTVSQSNVPSRILGVTFLSVSPGRDFSCGLSTAGVSYCWGNNLNGNLGDGTTVQRTSPIRISDQDNVAMISAGGFHACWLTTDGRASCWGLNQYGELGNGTTASSSNPVAVSGGLTFAMISAGNRHTCGVTTGGVAYCWGDNSNGNLGTGTLTNSSVPVAVAGGLTFASVSAGRFHTCGVTTGGAAYCWGDNAGGRLGDGTTVNSLLPVPVR